MSDFLTWLTLVPASVLMVLVIVACAVGVAACCYHRPWRTP